jgi:hypothetical protein
MKRYLSTIALILCLAAVTRSSAQVRLEKAVVSSGGGTATTQTMRLNYTIGQPVIGYAGNQTMKGAFGFWNNAFAVIPSGVSTEAGAGAITSMRVTPNPVLEDATVELTLAKGGALEIGLYDLKGRLAETIFSGEHAAGTFSVPFDASRIASGTYFVTISVPGALLQKPITIVR